MHGSGFETEVVVALAPAAAGSASVEIVERKGLGHPDSICDGIMESISVALCREYFARFGRILHYNCDKCLLAAGRVERQFGGGRVREPMRLVIGDRATADFEGCHIDVADIAIDTTRAWLADHIPHLDPLRHVTYQVEFRPGSEELRALFAEDGLTEVAGAATINGWQAHRLGTVGKPLPGVEVRIAEGGEILIKGATVTDSGGSLARLVAGSGRGRPALLGASLQVCRVVTGATSSRGVWARSLPAAGSAWRPASAA